MVEKIFKLSSVKDYQAESLLFILRKEVAF